MDDVAEFADQVYVMEKGKLVKGGKPSLVFQNVEFMEKSNWVFLKSHDLLKG